MWLVLISVFHRLFLSAWFLLPYWNYPSNWRLAMRCCSMWMSCPFGDVMTNFQYRLVWVDFIAKKSLHMRKKMLIKNCNDCISWRKKQLIRMLGTRTKCELSEYWMCGTLTAIYIHCLNFDIKTKTRVMRNLFASGKKWRILRLPIKDSGKDSRQSTCGICLYPFCL